MNKKKIHPNPEVVSKRLNKAITDEFDDRVKGNTLCKKCRK